MDTAGFKTIQPPVTATLPQPPELNLVNRLQILLQKSIKIIMVHSGSKEITDLLSTLRNLAPGSQGRRQLTFMKHWNTASEVNTVSVNMTNIVFSLMQARVSMVIVVVK